MADTTYSFSIKGIGVGEEKTLSVQILNDRTGTVIGALVFSGADAVKEFLDTMRGLASVVFPDPQKPERGYESLPAAWRRESRESEE